jgi:hypothetical protein
LADDRRNPSLTRLYGARTRPSPKPFVFGRLIDLTMERIGHKAHSFAEAEEWDRQQMWAMTPDERMEVARILRERAFGADQPDVREAERARREGGIRASNGP